MVIISNGFSKFHLAAAAAEADRRGLLTTFITGAYPRPPLRALLTLPGLRSISKLNRLMARAEQIDDRRIRALFFPELIHSFGSISHSEAMVLTSYLAYGRAATPHIRHAAENNARIYHYRAGFGGDSVAVARSLGLFVLCDHSIAHPAVVKELVENNGEMRRRSGEERIGASWRYMQGDIEAADAVLVNSQFVKSTFEFAGFDCSRVHVIYQGVDDRFMTHIPQREWAGGELRLLFAGFFGKRKGADVVIEALRRLDGVPWRLEIAGGVHPQVAKENSGFFDDPRVKRLGLLSRKELAEVMSQTEVFLFPSLAEGSARVVFEALACGCYVVTTPNSGSIVEHGVHGGLVPPGDSLAVAQAIEDAYRNRQRTAEIGRQNADLVRSKYRQCDYGGQLEFLYQDLLARHERKKDMPVRLSEN